MRTIYCDPEGSDEHGNGSEWNPFKTYRRAWVELFPEEEALMSMTSLKLPLPLRGSIVLQRLSLEENVEAAVQNYGQPRVSEEDQRIVNATEQYLKGRTMSTGAVSSIVDQLDKIKAMVQDAGYGAGHAAAAGAVQSILTNPFVIGMVADALGHGANIRWVLGFTSELVSALGALILSQKNQAIKHLNQAQAMLKPNELSPDTRSSRLVASSTKTYWRRSNAKSRP